MASVQQIKSDVELVFKDYLMGNLPPHEHFSTSSSSSSLSTINSHSSNSSSDMDYHFLTGLTDEEYKLPAVVVICQKAILNPKSFNWDCEVDVKIINHYADSTRAEHNNKVAEIRDMLIVSTEDLIPILNSSWGYLDALLYTPTTSKREVVNKKRITTQSFNLKCNLNGWIYSSSSS